jgi:hypothetical protein
MEYLYTGHFELATYNRADSEYSMTLLLQLLALADRFLVDSLKEHCVLLLLDAVERSVETTPNKAQSTATASQWVVADDTSLSAAACAQLLSHCVSLAPNGSTARAKCVHLFALQFDAICDTPPFLEMIATPGSAPLMMEIMKARGALRSNSASTSSSSSAITAAGTTTATPIATTATTSPSAEGATSPTETNGLAATATGINANPFGAGTLGTAISGLSAFHSERRSSL